MAAAVAAAGAISAAAAGRQHQHPKTIDRPPTKPKKVKPITKAMEEGNEPMRSFSDLQQLFDKKKEKPKPEEPPSRQPAGCS